MSISKKLRFLILKRDCFTCQYCGRMASESALEVDHVVPKSAGGEDVVQNLVTACVLCNKGKGAIELDEVSFAIELGYEVFKREWRQAYGEFPPTGELRKYWAREIAPALRTACTKNPDEEHTAFCCTVGAVEVDYGTEAFREGWYATPWESMLVWGRKEP